MDIELLLKALLNRTGPITLTEKEIQVAEDQGTKVIETVGAENETAYVVYNE